MRQTEEEIDLRDKPSGSSEPPMYMTEGERNFGGRHFKPSVQKARRRRKAIIFAIVVALIAAALAFVPNLRANIAALAAMKHPEGQSGVWRMVFNDEFNGATLSDSKWNLCYPSNDPNDPTPAGCSNRPEEQWYQGENVTLKDGLLNLTAKKEESNGFKYTSGIVTTGPQVKHSGEENKFSFKYGYVEARVKVPKGQGLWPAVWMIPSDGSGPPEIDLLEVLGHDTKTSYTTVHWALDQSSKSITAIDSVDFADGFHTVGVNWTADSIEWYFDGQRVKRFVGKDQIPHMEMFLLANLAVGGAWPGSPNSSTQFPADYQIDWVRVWKPITG